MNVAIVGATGLVGGVMIKVLEERNFPVGRLIPVASERSVGKEVRFKDQSFSVIGLEEAVSLKPDVALFSAGGATSLAWAPRFAEAGTTVIDNSSAWRKEPGVPLVVPEVNAHILKKTDKIIANPNCSTIPLVVVLNTLHQRYILKRVVVSTYQSVTGSGMKGVKQLTEERAGKTSPLFYPYPIDLNIIPQGGAFTENGYTLEEIKLMDESRKILGIPDLRITGTVVRVPVLGGHSESVNIELEKDFVLEEVCSMLAATPGVILQNDHSKQEYPMPLYAGGKDEVFVGRIRRDDSLPAGLNLWLVSDNLRKGAATNAVQIAGYLLEKGYL
ncbi:MAG: aspartate-semialdehyde dehydrogenase [Bacteroidetes bacterium]|nr:aspartate-semialdehyde dehydrogenase [Bacteroidota bacterium]